MRVLTYADQELHHLCLPRISILPLEVGSKVNSSLFTTFICNFDLQLLFTTFDDKLQNELKINLTKSHQMLIVKYRWQPQHGAELGTA